MEQHFPDFFRYNSTEKIFFCTFATQRNTMSEHSTTYQQQPKPLVSFIITYFNQPVSMLKECMESIVSLSLSTDEREIIIIDDGSASQPVDLLHDYEQEMVYLRQHNQGVSIARNRGMEMATGEYIQLVDADDKIIATPYNHCLDIIRKQEQNERADVVMFHFTQKSSPEMSEGKILHIQSGATYMRNNNVRGAACCFFFRKSILGTLRFTPGIAYGEDEEFVTLLLLRAESVCDTDFQAYYYRPNPSSATRLTNQEAITKRLDDTHTVICRLHAQEDNWPPEEREALRRKVSQLTMDYLYNTMRLTSSIKEVERRIAELTKEGLFPLPDNHYTIKYKWFQRLTASPLGRSILCRTLPLIKNSL